MATKKIKIEKKHLCFNFPVRIIDRAEQEKNIMDAAEEARRISANAPVERELEVIADRSNQLEQSTAPSSSRKFSGVAYSGLPVKQHFIFENLFLDVDGMTFKDQIPIFKNHDADKIVGYGSLTKHEGQLLIDGNLITGVDEAQDIATLSDNGFKWELSVGVNPEYIEEFSQGQTFSMNGSDHEGPAVVFRSPNVFETSFVAVGADKNASAQIFSKDLNEITEIEVKKMETIELNINGQQTEVVKTETGYEFKMEVAELELDKEYTFGCACESKQSKEDELSEALAAAQAEIAELKKAKRKERFSAAVETSAVEFDEEQFELIADLEEEKFAAFLSKIEGTKVSAETGKPAPKAELFKQDEAAEATLSTDSSVKEWSAKAKLLMKDRESAGKPITFTQAMSELNKAQA